MAVKDYDVFSTHGGDYWHFKRKAWREGGRECDGFSDVILSRHDRNHNNRLQNTSVLFDLISWKSVFGTPPTCEMSSLSLGQT